MSESYTIGGDTWQPLVGFDISGQTFTPLETHTINFIDLNLWLFSYTPPSVTLWQCDPSHEPISPMLSDTHVIEPLIYLPPAQCRIRFQLDTPVTLDQGTIYAIWARRDIGHVGPNNQWLYDKDDATYPRGHVIFSDDGGHTWTHFHGHDFIFTEFGNPPLPKPEPAPPIAHFATLRLTYDHHPTTITFTLATSVPCHLDCFYTEIKPVKHPTERIIRGARLLWGTYFCFVAWKLVEQTEPGDTLYHTFEMPDWAYCQIKWFTFRGTVDQLNSPSIGPIFTHHHPGAPIVKTFPCRDSYRYLSNYAASRSYLTAHNSPSGYVSSLLSAYQLGQQLTARYYWIFRQGLLFDTHSLPSDAIITEATLHIFSVLGDQMPDDIVIVNGHDLTEPLLRAHYHDLLDEIDSFGSTPYIAPYTWHEIQLNALGLAAINKTGLTKLGLRSSRDIVAQAPAFWEFTRFASTTRPEAPYLTVTYQKA